MSSPIVILKSNRNLCRGKGWAAAWDPWATGPRCGPAFGCQSPARAGRWERGRLPRQLFLQKTSSFLALQRERVRSALKTPPEGICTCSGLWRRGCCHSPGPVGAPVGPGEDRLPSGRLPGIVTGEAFLNRHGDLEGEIS